MFVELDQTFTEDLNNASSDKYNDLESRMTPVVSALITPYTVQS